MANTTGYIEIHVTEFFYSINDVPITHFRPHNDSNKKILFLHIFSFLFVKNFLLTIKNSSQESHLGY